jgi:hypothetical protein
MCLYDISIIGGGDRRTGRGEQKRGEERREEERSGEEKLCGSVF